MNSKSSYGNKYLPDVLFNQELKERFIDLQKNAGTKTFYRYVFQKSYNTEMALNKDIYQFNDQEINILRHSYENGSMGAAQSIRSVLRQYLQFCVDNEYIRINLLQDTFGCEELTPFINQHTQNKRIISRKEMEEICGYCENAQDAYVIVAPFEGLKGKWNSEIINLQEKDIDWTKNELTLTTYEGDSRKIIVSDFFMDIIEKALKETVYIKNNGETASNIISKTFPIYKTPYVMRPSARQCLGAVDQVNVLARLRKIRTFWGNPYLTTQSLYQSGMIDMAKKIKESNNGFELSKEDWECIAKQYGYNAKYWAKVKEKCEKMLDGNFDDEEKENKE